ncbi:hypothetical protein VTG60DRAFT_2306 [Thermothelomyces hinnuleus]
MTKEHGSENRDRYGRHFLKVIPLLARMGKVLGNLPSPNRSRSFLVDCQPLASASSTVSRAEAEHSTARIGSREVATRLRMKRKHCGYGSYRFMIAFFSPSCICIKMYASLIGGKHTKFQGCWQGVTQPGICAMPRSEPCSLEQCKEGGRPRPPAVDWLCGLALSLVRPCLRNQSALAAQCSRVETARLGSDEGMSGAPV